MKTPLTYKKAGVDIDAGNKFVQIIKPLVRQTFRPEVVTDIGGFGGLFALKVKKYNNPILVSSTDGVGTKLKIAFLTGKHDTVGIDLVAMCVNDVVVQGAEPLFLLDYLATGQLSLEVSTQIIKGIARGCLQAGCALIGGETAEMPSFYQKGEYDLAGFAVGVVEKKKIIDGSAIRAGDQLIGLASSGLHSNGYSLARKVLFEVMRLKIDSRVPGLSRSLGEELLIPTKIYVKPLLDLFSKFQIHGLAHITGGGITDNLPRIIPRGLQAIVRRGTWPVPPIFNLIKEGGNIAEEEMWRTFNNGLGMILVVPSREVTSVMEALKKWREKAFHIGEVRRAKDLKERITYL
ncbi:MAG: phosphoribosylformylglycinamidine cyclo-ligase [Thermodesulfobacteriota bacterium]